jgi:hypothetical protein
MGYEYNDKLKKKACNELEEYGNKSKLSYEDWNVIHLLEDTVKNINKNKMLEESEGEYSEARGGMRGRSYMGGMSYDDDMMYSERRGRGRNARRDSMGRYSSEGGYDDYSEERMDRRYSRDDAKDHIMRKLGAMMEDASPNERETLKMAMREIEKAD